MLASWAVPKGPTLDSKIRRMAVHVEDHPMEYFDFEGVIPAKQYGAGDVIVWDWGTWEPEAETPDPAAAVANGELKFVLSGEKVKGRFTIVRTSRRPGTAPRTAFEDDEGEQWLLIHKKGPGNVPGWDAEDHPQSVKSGRTNDEVKANAPAIWVSAAPAATAEIDLSAARDAPMPRYLEPMKATLATKAFRDEDWLYELKWDGYRVEAVVRDGKVQLFTRNGNDAEAYFPRLLNPPTWIDAREAIVDGEVVALDERGHPDFSLLQERISEGRTGRPVPLVLPGVRPAVPRRPVAGRRPARVAQAAARARDPARRAASSTASRSRPRASRSSRRSRRRAWRGSSRSIADPGTSPAAAPRRG